MTRRLLGAMVAMSAAVAGCGDSAPSKEAFLAKVDPICATAIEKAVAYASSTVFDEFRQFHAGLADGIDKTLAEIERLKFPKGDDGKAAKAWLAALREAAVAARAVVTAVDSGDFGAMETRARHAADAVKAADGQARAYGADECGRREADAVDRMTTVLPTTVKQEYIRRADEQCMVVFNVIDHLVEGDTIEELKRFLEEGGARIEMLVADLKEIPPPVTGKEELAGVMAAFDEVVSSFKGAREAIGTNDRSRMLAAFKQVDVSITAAQAKAEVFGFSDCAG